MIASETRVIEYIREQIKKSPNHVPPTHADIKRYFGPNVPLNLDKLIESEFRKHWSKTHKNFTLTLQRGEHKCLDGSTIIAPKRINIRRLKKTKTAKPSEQVIQPVLSILADTPHRTIAEHYAIIEEKARTSAHPGNENFVPPPWPKHRNVTTQTADTLKFLGEVFGVNV